MVARSRQAFLRMRQLSAVVIGSISTIVAVLALRQLMLSGGGDHVNHVTTLAVAGASVVIAIGLWSRSKGQTIVTCGLIAAIFAFPLGRVVGSYLYSATGLSSADYALQFAVSAILSALVFWITRRSGMLEPADVAVRADAALESAGVEGHHAALAQVTETQSASALPVAERPDDARERRLSFHRIPDSWRTLSEWAQRTFSAPIGRGILASLAVVGCVFLVSSFFQKHDAPTQVASDLDACDITISGGDWRISASLSSASVSLNTADRSRPPNKFEYNGLGGATATLAPHFVFYADGNGSLMTVFFLKKNDERISPDDSEAFAIFNNLAQDELVLRGSAASGVFHFPGAAQRLADFAVQSGKADERIQGVYFVKGAPVAQLFFSPGGLQAAYKKAVSERGRIADLAKRGACLGNQVADRSKPQTGDGIAAPKVASPVGRADRPTAVDQSERFRLQDFAELDAMIADAQSGKNPKLSASRADTPGEPLVLVRLNGKPAFAYAKFMAGSNGRQTALTFSCGANGTMDVTRVLFDGDAAKASLPIGANYELKFSAYGQSTEIVMPVKILKQFTEDSRLFVRVQGSAKASDPFFVNLAPTTNFMGQLKKDGVFQSAYRGIDLSDFDAQLKPLIDTCRGIDPAVAGGGRPGAAEGSDSETVNLYAGPSANQIRDALQRELAARLARVDAMANQCNTFKQQNNPIGAVMCLMTGGGAFSSKSIQVTIRSVTIDKCVISESEQAYCRYRADTNVQGTGMAGQVAPMFNTFLALEGWTYSSFSISENRWQWLNTFISCDFSSPSFSCRYYDRR